MSDGALYFSGRRIAMSPAVSGERSLREGISGGGRCAFGETGEKDDFGRVDSRPLVWIKIPNASTVIVGERRGTLKSRNF